MIVTLTPNPSLDRTIEVSQLRVGEVHRATGGCVDPGGKGVNVSRALAANGARSVAVLPGSGAAAAHFGALLDEAGVTHRFVDLADAIRTNITLVTADGTTTKINEQGRLSQAVDAEAMLDSTEVLLEDATWVVGCGSLPPGIDGALYAGLIDRARRMGVKVAIDTSGEALGDAVACRPDLIKPNLEELEELLGHPLGTVADVLAAAQDLNAQGVGTVVVSLGAQGALGVDATGAWHAMATVDKPLSTVGAGDCLLAGVLAALDSGSSLADALAQGVAWGAAAVALPGSSVPSPADVARVEVRRSAQIPLRLTVNDAAVALSPTT